MPFPCKYLGIPLSLGRLKRVDEQFLVDKVAARIPTWKSGLLTHAGRVLLTKVTLSAIPVHLSITCCLSAWAVEQIDKWRREFLWAGSQSVSGGKCKVAWQTVCKLTHLGGLGVLDLCFFGLALRLQWEWLARAEPGRAWSRLSSKPERDVTAMAIVSMLVMVGDGGSALLWIDSWAPVGRLCLYTPDLYAAVSRADKRRTLKEALFQNRWAHDVVGAPTTQVLCQYLLVWRLLADVELDPFQSDRFVWKWTAGGQYSASSAYRAFFAGSASLPGAVELWKAKAPPKVKFFF